MINTTNKNFELINTCALFCYLYIFIKVTEVKSTSEFVTTETLLYLIGNSSLPVDSLITQNTAHMTPAYIHVRMMQETN